MHDAKLRMYNLLYDLRVSPSQIGACSIVLSLCLEVIFLEQERFLGSLFGMSEFVNQHSNNGRLY